MTYIDRVKELIMKYNIPAQGCDIADIIKIEYELDIIFPVTYVEFLLVFGQNTGGFMLGFDIEARYLLDIQAEARDIIIRNNDTVFGKEYFVFCIHENYSFYMFKLDGVQDPNVFLFIDGDEGFETWISCGPLSNFIYENFLSQLESM